MGCFFQEWLLVAITGFLWALVGVVFSYASRQRVEFVVFMFVSHLCNAAIAWIFLFRPEELSSYENGYYLKMAAVMAAAGLFGALGFQLMGRAMRKGNRGIVWAVGQSAMILPMFTAVFFFGEELGLTNGLGISLILAGLLMIGIRSGASETPGSDSKGWLWMAYAVFVLVGISLSLTTLPSHWGNFHDDARLRLPVIFTVSTFYFLAQTIIKGLHHLKPRAIVLGMTYSIVVFMGQLFLYRSLDGFARFGRVGMVYPVAIGICVTIFSLYSVVFLKDKFKGLTPAGVFCIIAGIYLLAL